MAEKPHTKANFPVPPPFYQHFTKENVTEIRKLRKEKGISQPGKDNADNSNTPDLDPTSLAPDLRFLVPPAPPADGKWRTFGVSHDLNAPDPSLEDAGIEVLYPADQSVKLNPQPYLLSLSRSLLTTFLSLTGTLSEDPTQYEDSVADLKTLVTNMHDLINQYRPHQARETLILMMEERIERLRGEIKSIGEASEKMDGVFKELGESGETKVGHQDDRKAETGVKRVETGSDEEALRQRAAWDALQAAESDEDEGS